MVIVEDKMRTFLGQFLIYRSAIIEFVESVHLETMRVDNTFH